MIPHAALKQVLLILTEELFVVLYTCQVDVEKFVLWLCRLPYTILKCEVCSESSWTACAPSLYSHATVV
jgi:hypothetical protein